MSGSLRDQLLGAGFEEKKVVKKPAKSKKTYVKKPPARPTRQQQAKERASAVAKETEQEVKATAERKRIKAEIKALIEAAAAKEITGEKVYSYILGSRVKQIFLKPEYHEKVSKKELAITRLNGNTYLIPIDTSDQVKALNPDWAIIIASENKPVEGEKEYSDFQIPDDLHW